VLLMLCWHLFPAGDAFYRAESAQGRDLAVLAAAVHRRQHGQLRVLDVMAGSGMRGARYIQQV
jgi:tRNA (guanine26-N2/guanine27-N2)-dimethyltransferase